MRQLLVLTCIIISESCEYNVFFLYNYAGRYNEFNLAISKIVLRVNFERRYHPESCTAENAMWK